MGGDLVGHGWTAEETGDGVRLLHCESWSGFVDFINGKMLDFRNYIFRGQADETWKLDTTLDRALRDRPAPQRAKLRKALLPSFKFAARGRKGVLPFDAISDDDWWALGQHHGLFTPLLDWTESPFVAAYFATKPKEPQVGNRAVYALSRSSVERKSEGRDGKVLLGSVEFIRPLSDSNPRLITQRGLFTKGPYDVCVEEWVRKNFKGESGGAKLIKILLPSADREQALKGLNRMNINHLSLFPDLYGSAKYCNLELTIPKY